MTLNKLASLIAKREGKKHQASIGDIREILKILDKQFLNGKLVEILAVVERVNQAQLHIIEVHEEMRAKPKRASASKKRGKK